MSDDVIPLDRVMQAQPTQAPTPSVDDKGVIPLSRVQKTQEQDAGSPLSLHPKLGQFAAEEVGMENTMLGSSQFTSPYVHEHKKHYLGHATIDEEGNVGYKGEDDKFNPTDSSKHVVLRDTEDGKYKVYERHKDTNEGPISGRMLGFGRAIMSGMAGGPMPMKSVLPASTRTATTAGKVNQAVEELGKTTGVDITVPRTATTESAIRNTAARTISALPGGSSAFEKASGAMSQGLEHATEAAARLPTGGVESGAEAAGQAARAGITDYTKPKGILARSVSKAYDAVDNAMGAAATTTTDLPRTRQAAQDVLDELKAAKIEGTPPAIQKVLNAITDPDGIAHAGLRTLRTHIGEELETAAGTEQTILKRLYRGLTGDMEAHIETQGGPRAAQLWKRTNNYARLAADRKDKLATIIGSEGRGDEGIFGKLAAMAGTTTTANAKLLATARKAMKPDEWAEVASGMVSRLGKKGDQFDPGKFLTDYRKMSDHGKAIVFGESGDLRKSLDNIATITERWGQQKAIAHPAGEVGHLAGMAFAFHHGMKLIETILGMGMAARILSRPNTARYASKWMQSAEQLRLAPTPATITAFNNASRQFANEAATEERKTAGKAAKAAGSVVAPLAAGLIAVGAAFHEFGENRH